jgi:hypothetical protein
MPEFTADDFHEAADKLSRAEDHEAMRAAYDFVHTSSFSGAEMHPLSLGYGILIGLVAADKKRAKSA